ncbi:hypothetical protein VVD49_11700 [Uliginosibacterium sp. H3]|uniref:Uncharacterized protein n=1 Tax=Uliginosibacterium silvisoli TaxID=3114758 RepID=A0ABU6K4C6_9RHOO|nr:hypothetical protein [Uliginosibacterium sp. H3]
MPPPAASRDAIAGAGDAAGAASAAALAGIVETSSLALQAHSNITTAMARLLDTDFMQVSDRSGACSNPD